MMNTLPPAHEVQQAVRVAVQGFVGQAADMLTIEIPIDPRHFPTGILLDHADMFLCKSLSQAGCKFAVQLNSNQAGGFLRKQLGDRSLARTDFNNRLLRNIA